MVIVKYVYNHCKDFYSGMDDHKPYHVLTMAHMNLFDKERLTIYATPFLLQSGYVSSLLVYLLYQVCFKRFLGELLGENTLRELPKGTVT